MRIISVFIFLSCVALPACTPDSRPPTSVASPLTAPAVTATVQQIIVKPVASRPSVDAQGNLLLMYIADLGRVAGVGMNYVRPMSGGAHVLAFAQPIASAQANAIFSAWQNKGLVEYAEPDGVAYPSVH